ncbi:MAG: sigma-70 family RNA polymerase sigma factor [Eubacteriales bacterium]|nr:sigma-70 family RNA polymerase sigma factor [Eubacteriales bacterium]
MTNEQLIARIRAGEDEAENMLALWQRNKGFIAKMAKRYQGYAEMDDLMQEGYLGLCEAVRHYEADQGASFIHYAAFWIQQVMRRYIDNCSGVVRLPVHAREWISKYNKAVREYRQYYGESPTEAALCSLLGVGREKLHVIQESVQMGQIRSLSEPTVGEDDLTLSDTVASGEDLEADVMQALDRENMKRELWIAVNELPGDLSTVIRVRYQEGKTHKAVGQILGVSRNRAAQLEKDALRKLRLLGKSKKFRCYYEEYLSAAPIRHVGVERFLNTWTSEVEREALRQLEGTRRGDRWIKHIVRRAAREGAEVPEELEI